MVCVKCVSGQFVHETQFLHGRFQMYFNQQTAGSNLYPSENHHYNKNVLKRQEIFKSIPLKETQK